MDPRPLAVFEEYMLLDSSAHYPMECFCLFQFSGTLDRQIFENAVRFAASRHPLITCRIEKKKDRRFYWIPSGRDFPEILYHKKKVASDILQEFPAVDPLDVYQDNAFRIHLFETEKGWNILFQFHHAVCDGVGSQKCISDIFLEYAIQTGTAPEGAVHSKIDPDLLDLRGDLGWPFLDYIHDFTCTIRTTIRYLLFRVKTILKHSSKEDVRLERVPPSVHPAIDSRALDPEESRKYHQKAKEMGGSLNDLLLADLFSWIVRWQKKKGIYRRGGIYRNAVPMNLRRDQHENMPAANLVSMVFLDVFDREIDDPDHFVQRIHQKMNTIKKYHQGLYLNDILSWGRFLSRLVGSDLSLFLRRKSCQATVCLSNVGNLFDQYPLVRHSNGKYQMGDLLLDNGLTSPPIRSLTPISFLAMSFAGRLLLTIRYDPDLLSKTEAKDILDGYLDQIRARL